MDLTSYYALTDSDFYIFILLNYYVSESVEKDHPLGFERRLQYMGEIPTGVALRAQQDMLEFRLTLLSFKSILETSI